MSKFFSISITKAIKFIAIGLINVALWLVSCYMHSMDNKEAFELHVRDQCSILSSFQSTPFSIYKFLLLDKKIFYLEKENSFKLLFRKKKLKINYINIFT